MALRPIAGTADIFLPTEKQFFGAHWVDCLKRSGENVNVNGQN
jgi:hypothetical protein